MFMTLFTAKDASNNNRGRAGTCLFSGIELIQVLANRQAYGQRIHKGNEKSDSTLD